MDCASARLVFRFQESRLLPSCIFCQLFSAKDEEEGEGEEHAGGHKRQGNGEFGPSADCQWANDAQGKENHNDCEHDRERGCSAQLVSSRLVDVVARFVKSGGFEPIAVCWKDGRTFPIDEILEVGVFGPPKRGRQVLKYRIRFGDHETELYLERCEARPMSGEPEALRWWVFALDRKPKKMET